MRTIDQLIFVGFNGYALALDRDTGDVVWSNNRLTSGYVTLLLDGDRLIVSCNGYMYCLDPLTGNIRLFSATSTGVYTGVDIGEGVIDKGIGTAASNMGAYVVAKYGLAGVLAAVAADYSWLRVRSVSPGYTETPMLSVFDDRFLALQRERQPFQTPDEVAQQIVEAALGT